MMRTVKFASVVALALAVSLPAYAGHDSRYGRHQQVGGNKGPAAAATRGVASEQFRGGAAQAPAFNQHANAAGAQQAGQAYCGAAFHHQMMTR